MRALRIQAREKSAVIEVAGEMFELATAKKTEQYSMEYKTAFYAQLLGYAVAKGSNPGSAYYRYKESLASSEHG